VRDHIANYRERRAEDVGQNDAPSTKSSRAQQNDEYVEGCNREMKESNVSTRKMLAARVKARGSECCRAVL